MAVAMNPNEAHSGGDAALEAAARLFHLPRDFAEAVVAARGATKPEPGFTPAHWDTFGEDQAQFMSDVQRHAETLGENIQAGAVEGARTDTEAGEDFNNSRVSPVSREVNLF
ncbi:hypothetical protein KIK06_18515 [Nocardiopsis sp. EMB25]|uniref:hypothetical protein n=1 Tax=Nocardiopsis sp. EMB25 TaxID=2835867 RepID=UPI0022844C23|nr:hypothetical protein [Nocardiopsis sp. EMB25]MCY9785887.1 hypothetical protein [Nocardiopsis sp. EMB25]